MHYITPVKVNQLLIRRLLINLMHITDRWQLASCCCQRLTISLTFYKSKTTQLLIITIKQKCTSTHRVNSMVISTTASVQQQLFINRNYEVSRHLKVKLLFTEPQVRTLSCVAYILRSHSMFLTAAVSVHCSDWHHHFRSKVANYEGKFYISPLQPTQPKVVSVFQVNVILQLWLRLTVAFVMVHIRVATGLVLGVTFGPGIPVSQSRTSRHRVINGCVQFHWMNRCDQRDH